MMQTRRKQIGFSLTEVLLATGILAVGFVLIAMVFPAGIKLTSMAAEKTFSPVIAEEARSIIQLYGLDPAKLPAAGSLNSAVFSAEYLSDQSLKYFFRNMIYPDPFDPVSSPLPLPGQPLYEDLMNTVNDRLAADSLYPSLPKDYFNQNPAQKQRYGWAALCRQRATAPQQADVNIFICRRSEGLRYYGFTYNRTTGVFTAAEVDRPIPVPVEVTPAGNQVTITGGPVYPLQTCIQFFTEGAKVIADRFGSDYQIIKREDLDSNGTFETLTLDTNYDNTENNLIWVVPPAVGIERNICIDVL